MKWLCALLLLGAAASTSSANQSPVVDWQFAPPWQPLHAPCLSCRQGSRAIEDDQQTSASTKHVAKLNTITFENLKPGVPTRLTPDGSTTIVKMAMEKFQTSDNSSVQLVYIPQRGLSNIADEHSNKMIASESSPAPATDFAPAVLNAPSSAKQKRDHRIQGGSTGNIKSFPMTLVAAEGKEAAAREQLQLLEAALSSPEATRSKNGELPRVFIAPSNIPPPPGYVKIPLVPQKQTQKSNNKLPSTFLTHSNPRPLPPGFVRLSLPSSVSHLSNEIPLVKPEKLPSPSSVNPVSGSSTAKQTSRENVVRNHSTPPPPLFEARGNSIKDTTRHVIGKDIFDSQQDFSFPQTRGNRNEIETENFSQPELILQNVGRPEIRNERTPLPAIHQQQTDHFNLPQHSRPDHRLKETDGGHAISRENSFRETVNNKKEAQELSERPRPQPHTLAVPSQGQQPDFSDPRFIVRTNLSPGNFEHQLRLQNFNQNVPRSQPSISQSPKNFQQIGRPVSTGVFNQPQPIGGNLFPNNGVFVHPHPSGGNSFINHAGLSQPQPSRVNHFTNSGGFNQPQPKPITKERPLKENTVRESSERSRPLPVAHGFSTTEDGPRSFVNQNIAHPGIQSHESFQSSSAVRTNKGDNSRLASSKKAFQPLPNAVSNQEIHALIENSGRGSEVASSTFSSFPSNSKERNVQLPGTESVDLKLIPAKGIRVTSRGEPKPLEQPRSGSVATTESNNFVSPQTFSHSSTTAAPQLQRGIHIPALNILSNIGTPATVSFRDRKPDLNGVQSIPPPHDPRFDEMIKKQEQGSARSREKDLSGRPETNHNVNPVNSIATQFVDAGPPVVRLQSNVRVNTHDREQHRQPSNEAHDDRIPIRVTSFPQSAPPSPQAPFSPHNHFRGNHAFHQTTAAPRITTFSPKNRFRVPTSTFSSVATPFPFLGTSTFDLPRSLPFTTSIPSSSPFITTTQSSVIDENRFVNENTEAFFDSTDSPFISGAGQAFSSDSPSFFTTIRPDGSVPSFTGSPDIPSFFESTTSPPFSPNRAFPSSSTVRPLGFTSDRASSEVRTVGPFKIQPFFNSFAVPHSIPNSLESQQQSVSSQQQFEIARNEARRPFLSSSTASPPALHEPFRNSQQTHDNLHLASPITDNRHTGQISALPAISNQGLRGRFQGNNGRLPQQPPPFNQLEPFNDGHFLRPQPDNVSPTPEKIDVPQGDFVNEKNEGEEIQHENPNDKEVEDSVVILKENTFKPNFGVVGTKSNGRSTTNSITQFASTTPALISDHENESSLGFVDKTEETTIFPPFNVVRKRQRLNKGTDEVKEKHEEPAKKTHPLVFTRKLRQRFRPTQNADQASSGSKPTVVSRITTTSTTPPANARSRLNISNRIRGRNRPTSTTTESVLSEQLTPADEIQETGLSLAEAGLVMKTISDGAQQDDESPKLRKRLPQGQRRKRPGGRRVPEWVKERRRRLRNNLTTEPPVIQETSLDDPPADFIENNDFPLAESARVTFTQPRENLPQSNEEEATDRSPATENLEGDVTEHYREDDTVTEENLDEQTTETVFSDAIDNAHEISEGISTSSTTTSAPSISSAEFGLRNDSGIQEKARPQIDRRIVPLHTRTYVQQGKSQINDFDSEKLTILETSKYQGRFPSFNLPAAIKPPTRSFLSRGQQYFKAPSIRDRVSFLDRGARDRESDRNADKQEQDEIAHDKSEPQGKLMDGKGETGRKIIALGDENDPTDLPKSKDGNVSVFDLGPNVEFISTRVSSVAPTTDIQTSEFDDSPVQDESETGKKDYRKDKKPKTFPDNAYDVDLGVGAIFDSQKVEAPDEEMIIGIHQSEEAGLSNEGQGPRTSSNPSESDDEEVGGAVAESRTHIVYAQAPSEVAEIYEKLDTPSAGDQNYDVEPVTQISNDSAINTDSFISSAQPFRTVEEGFKKAEETQTPVRDVSLESTLPVIEAPQKSSTMSTFEEIESLLRSRPVSNEEEHKISKGDNPRADLAGKEGTVIGQSTVLEIRSSEPKVCFSNGRCIPAKGSNRR
ncbi:uncharacterized protein LOC108681242 isoform X2 [Hyalella azteca]|uniref:Uncharacterized protein LOC108681242 isoform X2 n=1 Tax=Hyalella azteca TaxID=294128 RepID=A0A8B7PHV7_HYAAZ|nr:uncharacterized protein LOC108681242 isoform X2 [Hyalella azteca]